MMPKYQEPTLNGQPLPPEMQRRLEHIRRETDIALADMEGYLGQPVPGALQDNRCPICLGDIYTCDCGKVKR